MPSQRNGEPAASPPRSFTWKAPARTPPPKVSVKAEEQGSSTAHARSTSWRRFSQKTQRADCDNLARTDQRPAVPQSDCSVTMKPSPQIVGSTQGPAAPRSDPSGITKPPQNITSEKL